MSERGFARGLLGGSAVLLVVVNLANGLHFAFHVLMARRLGPASYGALAALMAMLLVLGVIPETVQTVMARYVARQQDPGAVRTLVTRSLRYASRAAAALLATYLLLAFALAPLLRVPYALMAIFGLSVAALPLLPVPRGALLGLQRFGSYSCTMAVEVVVKLGLGAAWVAIGGAEFGAGGAVGMSLLAAFACGLLLLADVRRTEPRDASASDAVAYAVPVLALTATVMAFYSLDVVLARALLPARAAGEYAVASLIGKGILLGAQPIARVMLRLPAVYCSPNVAFLLGAAMLVAQPGREGLGRVA